MEPTTHPLAAHRRRLFALGIAVTTIIAAAGIAIYGVTAASRISISDAQVTAPLIDLAPSAPGKLTSVYVQEGDTVPAYAPVAQVGTEVIKTKTAGIIVHVNDTVGATVGPSSPIVQMIDPTQLRVVGRLDENKGLAQVAVGDPVVFTVDAFGGEQFPAVVDEVSPTSNQSGIVFNISSQRQVQQFLVKARFDQQAFPTLKNGMSARMWVYSR